MGSISCSRFTAIQVSTRSTWRCGVAYDITDGRRREDVAVPLPGYGMRIQVVRGCAGSGPRSVSASTPSKTRCGCIRPTPRPSPSGTSSAPGSSRSVPTTGWSGDRIATRTDHLQEPRKRLGPRNSVSAAQRLCTWRR